MDAEEHFRRLERMYATAPINRFYLPVMRVSEGRAEISVTVRPEFFHAAQAVHGSVYFKLLDDAAFFAVNSLVPDVFVLTASYHLHFLRPVGAGRLTAVGRVVHPSSRMFVAEAELRDENARVLGRGSGSFMRSQIALGPAVGYT